MLQWAFALPVTLLRLPYSLVESALWSGMLYWIIGFDPDAGRWLPVRYTIPGRKKCPASLNDPALALIALEMIVPLYDGPCHLKAASQSSCMMQPEVCSMHVSTPAI